MEKDQTISIKRLLETAVKKFNGNLIKRNKKIFLIDDSFVQYESKYDNLINILKIFIHK